MTIIRKGVVVSGEYSGWNISIDDDREGGTGGYYLFLTSSDGRAFNFWFELELHLDNHLSEFDIGWLS
ncbi:hypothetical protein GV819_30585 [Pseudomonas sp. Fl5BN2]|uniref:hypothetical protein n=1 Tax=Pseudomonas sp. Fl5BN2 TaxID=2697652 RepID=UPI001377593D|nr:hypothetical protein [Pseudomonas sp. Fl5BN2]NBF06622.1 hypothetical protein [Pseudomonas sp. Fl5BN2]